MKSRQNIINLADFIDVRVISALQWRIFMLCGLVNLLDGADSQSIGVAGPMIAAEWHMKMSLFSPAFSVGLLGAAIGALSFGGLADRFGRKRMLVVAALILSAFTLLTPAASNFPELLTVRFIAGLGLGGATPCFITLTAEYAPKRSRATIASVLWAAYPFGASLGGILNAYLIPELGWRSVFYIGGTISLVTSILLMTFLPESLAFLTTQRKRNDEIATIIRKIDPVIGLAAVTFMTSTGKRAGGTLKNLFAEGRGLGTLLLWGMFFTAFGSTTIGVLLMPTLFRVSGISLSMAALLVGLFNFVSVASMASAGKLVTKLGAAILVAAFVCGAGALTLLGQVGASLPLATAGMVLLGLTVSLAASGGIALAALAYPTEIRSTGVGWAMGMGRFGQVLSPLLVGGMLGLSWDVSTILTAVSAVPLLGGLFCLTRMAVMRRPTMPTVSLRVKAAGSD